RDARRRGDLELADDVADALDLGGERDEASRVADDAGDVRAVGGEALVLAECARVTELVLPVVVVDLVRGDLRGRGAPVARGAKRRARLIEVVAAEERSE